MFTCEAFQTRVLCLLTGQLTAKPACWQTRHSQPFVVPEQRREGGGGFQDNAFCTFSADREADCDASMVANSPRRAMYCRGPSWGTSPTAEILQRCVLVLRPLSRKVMAARAALSIASSALVYAHSASIPIKRYHRMASSRSFCVCNPV